MCIYINIYIFVNVNPHVHIHIHIHICTPCWNTHTRARTHINKPTHARVHKNTAHTHVKLSLPPRPQTHTHNMSYNVVCQSLICASCVYVCVCACAKMYPCIHRSLFHMNARVHVFIGLFWAIYPNKSRLHKFPWICWFACIHTSLMSYVFEPVSFAQVFMRVQVCMHSYVSFEQCFQMGLFAKISMNNDVCMYSYVSFERCIRIGLFCTRFHENSRVHVFIRLFWAMHPQTPCTYPCTLALYFNAVCCSVLQCVAVCCSVVQ